MKNLMFIAVSLLLAACSDSDKNNSIPSFLADTKWELVKEQGYEVSGGNREEWDSKSEDFDATYVFKKDNTGTYTAFESVDGNMDSTISVITWEHSVTAAALAIRFTESGDQKMYKIMSWGGDPMTLRLQIRKVEPEYDYEFYNEETYVKK